VLKARTLAGGIRPANQALYAAQNGDQIERRSLPRDLHELVDGLEPVRERAQPTMS
jgi:hypothetical protein